MNHRSGSPMPSGRPPFDHHRRLLIDGGPLAYFDGGLPNVIRRLVLALPDHAPGLEWTLVTPAAAVDAVPAPARPFTVPVTHGLRNAKPLRRELAWQGTLAAWWHRHAPGARLFGMLVVGPCAALHPRGILLLPDTIPDHDPACAGGPFRRLLRAAAMRLAHGSGTLLTLSDDARADLARLWSHRTRSLHVLPLWLPPEFARRGTDAEAARVRRRLGLPGSYWLYVGGYRAYKNVDGLIEAYGRARSRAGHALPPLVLAGNAPAPGTYPGAPDIPAAMAAHHLGPSDVLCPGFIHDDDLPGLFRGARLFVTASRHEGFGYPALEAATVGTPVLAPRTTSWPEVVTNPDCLYDLADPHDLPSRLVAASRHPSAFLTRPSPRHTPAAGVAAFLAATGLDGTSAQRHLP